MYWYVDMIDEFSWCCVGVFFGFIDYDEVW